MKKLNVSLVISLFVLVFTGCPGGGLSPDSADPNNPASVNELVAAVSADEAAWKDKKVSATGYVGGKSTSGRKYTLTIRHDKESGFEKTITCVGEGEVPADIMSKNDNWIFTGTVGQVEKGKRAQLDSCEIKSK